MEAKAQEEDAEVLVQSDSDIPVIGGLRIGHIRKLFAFIFVGIGVSLIVAAVYIRREQARLVECQAEIPSTITTDPCVQETLIFDDGGFKDCFHTRMLTIDFEEHCRGRIDPTEGQDNEKGSLRLQRDAILFYDLVFSDDQLGVGYRAHLLDVQNSIPRFQLMAGAVNHSRDKCFSRNETSNNPNKILYPCGLYASVLYNDTFQVVGHRLDSSYEAFQISHRERLKNPDNPVFYMWIPEEIFPGGLENFHVNAWFSINWEYPMRKPYGIIRGPIDFPLVINVSERYPLSTMPVTKHITIRELTFVGSTNAKIFRTVLSTGLLTTIVGLVVLCGPDWHRRRLPMGIEATTGEDQASDGDSDKKQDGEPPTSNHTSRIVAGNSGLTKRSSKPSSHGGRSFSYIADDSRIGGRPNLPQQTVEAQDTLEYPKFDTREQRSSWQAMKM